MGKAAATATAQASGELLRQKVGNMQLGLRPFAGAGAAEAGSEHLDGCRDEFLALPSTRANYVEFNAAADEGIAQCEVDAACPAEAEDSDARSPEKSSTPVA